MESAVRKAVQDPMPDAKEFAVSILAPEGDSRGVGHGLLEPLDWTPGVRRNKAALSSLPRASIDPLFLPRDAGREQRQLDSADR